jgi:hypothetical protein
VPGSLVAILLVQDLAGRLGIPLKGRPGRPAEVDRAAAGRAARARRPGRGPVRAGRERDPRPARGRLVAGGGGQYGIRLFRGAGVTLSVMVLGPGAFSGINQATARRVGREVAGIGDRAWLANQDRTLIAVADPATVKLTLSGLPPGEAPGALIPLAATVIGRLGDAAERAGGP